MNRIGISNLPFAILDVVGQILGDISSFINSTISKWETGASVPNIYQFIAVNDIYFIIEGPYLGYLTEKVSQTRFFCY